MGFGSTPPEEVLWHGLWTYFGANRTLDSCLTSWLTEIYSSKTVVNTSIHTKTLNFSFFFFLRKKHLSKSRQWICVFLDLCNKLLSFFACLNVFKQKIRKKRLENIIIKQKIRKLPVFKGKIRKKRPNLNTSQPRIDALLEVVSWELDWLCLSCKPNIMFMFILFRSHLVAYPRWRSSWLFTSFAAWH